MLPDRADQLTALDVTDGRHAAIRAGMVAVSAIRNIMHQTQALTLLVEGEIESRQHQERAVQIAGANERDALMIAETLHELIAQHTALLAMAEVLIQQRDQALRGEDSFYEQMIERVAEIQGCSKEQAYKLVATLTNTDEDLLAADVVIGADRLDTFRDELSTLLEVLEDFDYPDDEHLLEEDEEACWTR